MLIGISGVAGCGKDLFAELLIKKFKEKGLKSKRFALADILKEESRSLILDKYGIDPTNCSREDKERIRGELVSFAKHKRIESNGRYWIEKLQEKIKASEKLDYYLVSDLRYSEYDRDEVFWVKEENKGILVHISKYFIEGCDVRPLLPANSEEHKNDPILLDKADYHVLWSHGCQNPESRAQSFFKWLILNEEVK